MIHAEYGVTSSDSSSSTCDHCSWVVTEDCPQDTPLGQQIDCFAATHDADCARHQVAEKFWLSVDGAGYGALGVYCLGGAARVVPIGDIAKADVGRYLHDVTPPPLDVSLDPSTSLAGLATKATANPAAHDPAQFTGGGVTETITVAPAREDWRWGDGTGSTYRPGSDGAIDAQHTYTTGAHVTAEITTTWGATYAVTYQGETFGPYTATGTLTRRQTLPVTVATSTPVLVHG